MRQSASPFARSQIVTPSQKPQPFLASARSATAIPATGGPLPNSGTAFRASPIKCDKHCARVRQLNPGPRLPSSFEAAIRRSRGSLRNLTEF